jgi:thioredoxin reductase
MDFHRDTLPTTSAEADVLILGGSIAALMAGSYLKLQNPDLDVVLLGPSP